MTLPSSFFCTGTGAGVVCLGGVCLRGVCFGEGACGCFGVGTGGGLRDDFISARSRSSAAIFSTSGMWSLSTLRFSASLSDCLLLYRPSCVRIRLLLAPPAVSWRPRALCQHVSRVPVRDSLIPPQTPACGDSGVRLRYPCARVVPLLGLVPL